MLWIFKQVKLCFFTLLFGLSPVFSMDKNDNTDGIFEKQKSQDSLFIQSHEFSKNHFEKLAQPHKPIVHSMAKTESPKDPWYIKEQRQLITGKTLKFLGFLTFRGADLPGDIITSLTKDQYGKPSEWSHTGLLLGDENNAQYCFESTGTVGQIFRGMLPQVQIHPLQKVVESYAGNVGVRYLHEDDFKQDTTLTTKLVWDWVGVSYEKRPIELLKSIKGQNHFDKDSEKSLFCSEMGALMAQLLGYLPYGEKYKPASNYLPRDFGMQGDGKGNLLTLLHGALSTVEILKNYIRKQCCVIL